MSRMSLLSDRIIATDELKRKEGQMLYLKNLEKVSNWNQIVHRIYHSN